MALVLDLRGSNGVGKSHIIHTFIEDYGKKEIEENGRPIATLIPKLNLVAMGTYNRQCGGCDGIKTQDEVCRRVRFFREQGKHHTLLEGVCSSHTFGRYNELALELGDDDYWFLFLNTPLKTAIKRVEARRKAKGNLKPFRPYKYMGLASDFDRVASARRKLKEAGRNVIDLDYRDPFPQVLKLLRQK